MTQEHEIREAASKNHVEVLDTEERKTGVISFNKQYLLTSYCFANTDILCSSNLYLCLYVISTTNLLLF